MELFEGAVLLGTPPNNLLDCWAVEEEGWLEEKRPLDCCVED